MIMEEKTLIPEYIITLYEKKYNAYPSFMQTKNVTVGAIDVLTKKNKILWFNDFSDGTIIIKNEGLVNYSDNHSIAVYYKRIESESVYKLYIMSTTENTNMVLLLIKGLTKFFTFELV
jgi:hypothetical protein